jgi:hypothetical protein
MTLKVYTATYSTVFISDSENANELKNLGLKYLKAEISNRRDAWKSVLINELTDVKNAPEGWCKHSCVWGTEDLNVELFELDLSLGDYFAIKSNPEEWMKKNKDKVRKREIEKKIKKLREEISTHAEEIVNLEGELQELI